MRKSVAAEQIASAIPVLRGHRVLLDAELPALHGSQVLASGGEDQFFKVANCNLKDRRRPQP